MNIELHEKAQAKAIHEAIVTYYISPQLIKRVCEFAEEKNIFFLKYSGSTGLYHFSDGEAYTAEAILRYFRLDPQILGGTYDGRN